VATVRSQAKADKIKEAYPDVGEDKLDFAIVEDIAQEGAFDKAVVSEPPFEAVIHTASPVCYDCNVFAWRESSLSRFSFTSTLSTLRRTFLIQQSTERQVRTAFK